MSSVATIVDDQLIRGFIERLHSLVEAQPELVRRLADTEKPYELGARAADYVVAPVIWRELVGELYDTTELSRFLSVSRQAIAQRVANRTLLALPGRGTRYYPLWQLDWSTSRIWDAVGGLLHAWHEVEPDVEPLTIATWAVTAQDYLNDHPPSEMIGTAPEAVIEAARITAHTRTR